MSGRRSIILGAVAGAALGVFSLLFWAAAGLMLQAAFQGFPLLRASPLPASFELLAVLIVVAAGLGGAAGAFKGHALCIPLRFLGRLLNIQAFLLFSGLPLIKASFMHFQFELDLTPLALALAVTYAIPQTLIDVYLMHTKA